MIYFFEEVTSTNDLARDAQFGHGDVLVAERQTAGRGQRGHTWLSVAGQNLTFTLVVEPKFLPARDQFFLSACSALALCDCFAHFGIETRIKWTNDIYVEDRKLVGILIEHFYAGANLRKTLIGIGINVNQTLFDPSLPNPTSMQLERGKAFDREAVLNHFYDCFMARYAQLVEGRTATLLADYHRLIYRLGCVQRFRLPEGKEFEATIEGIEEDGALKLLHNSGERQSYHFKEVEFVVKCAKNAKNG